MNAKPTTGQRHAAPTVFVADDDEGVRDSLQFLLKSVGLATKPLASAAEFLDTYDVNEAGCLGPFATRFARGSTL
jgi:FixJ family two-component response regulator